MKLKATWKQKDQAKWQVIGNMCRQRHATEVKDKMLQQLRDGELRAGERPWNSYQKKHVETWKRRSELQRSWWMNWGRKPHTINLLDALKRQNGSSNTAFGTNLQNTHTHTNAWRKRLKNQCRQTERHWPPSLPPNWWSLKPTAKPHKPPKIKRRVKWSWQKEVMHESG